MAGVVEFLAFGLPLFYSGGRSVIAGDSGLPEWMIAEGISLVYTTSAEMVALLGGAAVQCGSALPLRMLFSTARPVEEEAVEALEARGVEVREHYLSPLAGPNNFAFPEKTVMPGSVGTPLFHVEAMISGPDAKPRNDGERGELFLRGHHLFSGYWNRARLTRQAFLKGWLRTGVKASCRAGYFYLENTGHGRYTPEHK